MRLSYYNGIVLFREGIASRVSELLHQRYAKEASSQEVLNRTGGGVDMWPMWTLTVKYLEYVLILPGLACLMIITALVRSNYHAKRGNMTVKGQVYLALCYLGLYF